MKFLFPQCLIFEFSAGSIIIQLPNLFESMMLSPSGRQLKRKAGHVAAPVASSNVLVGQSASHPDSSQPLKVNWTDSVWEILINCYLEEATRNGFKDSCLKSASWTKVTAEFAMASGFAYSRVQLQSRWNAMKAKWMIYNDIVNLSGFGVDKVDSRPKCAPAVWAAYCDKHPGASVFSDSPLKFFERLTLCHAKHTADGRYATGSNSTTVCVSSRDVLLAVTTEVEELNGWGDDGPPNGQEEKSWELPALDGSDEGFPM
jgi:hypothetical protein